MSKEVFNAVCDCDLPPTTKAVAKELAWFADENGDQIFPSVETLSWRTGLQRRTVQLQLRTLEALTVIHRVTNGRGGRHRSTHYRFDQATLAALRRARPIHNGLFTQKGEAQRTERANSTVVKGESDSPKKYEHENGKENQHVPPAAAAAVPSTFTGEIKDKTKTPENRRALKVWIETKCQLQEIFEPDEWELWVRPALLLKLLSKQCLLIALPQNSEIHQAAWERLAMLRELLAERGYAVVLTTYPEAWEREQLRSRYPEFYRGMFGSDPQDRG